jgi:hypothetical protein
VVTGSPQPDGFPGERACYKGGFATGLCGLSVARLRRAPDDTFTIVGERGDGCDFLDRVGQAP